MYSVLERDFECVEECTVRRWLTQTMGWYHGWFSRHCFFFCSSAASLQLFLCVPLSVTSLRLRLSFPSAYRDAHTYAPVCVCLCYSILCTENSYSIFSLLLGFSFHLYWAARRFVLHMYMYMDLVVMSAHTDCRLYGPTFHAYIFSALFSFTAFVVISFVRLVSFSLLLLLLLLPLLVCRVHFSCLWKIDI